MRTGALVPFKRFTRAKRRLRTRYSDADVEAIGRAMLADVLAALRQAPSLERIVVLTDDPEVEIAARAAGSAVRLRDPDPGLNEVIDAASAELAGEGFDAALVVVGDLPLLQAADVESVIERGRADPVVIVPSSDGGTALLLRRPPLLVPARFGPASAAAHAEAARSAGVEAAMLEDLGRAAPIDLDTPEDAERILKAPIRCRTREVLAALARSGPR